MAKTFSQSDVAAHKKPDDLWIIVDEDVYDLTNFQAEHPGKSTSKHELWEAQANPIIGGQKSKRPVTLVLHEAQAD